MRLVSVKRLDHAAAEEQFGAFDEGAVGGDGLSRRLEDDAVFSGLLEVEHELACAGRGGDDLLQLK